MACIPSAGSMMSSGLLSDSWLYSPSQSTSFSDAMNAKQKKRHALFTEEDGVFQALRVTKDGLSDDAAWDYMDRYIKLRAKARQLEKKGLKARILLPDLPRRPMLVIWI